MTLDALQCRRAVALILCAGMALFGGSLHANSERVSVSTGGVPGNADSHGVDVSGNGRFVAFGSRASNLASNGNSAFNIYVRDRQLGLTELVSVNAQGVAGDSTSLWPSISSDGRYVVFHSIARNLVPNDDNFTADVFLYDRQTDTITLVSKAPDGTPGNGRSERAEISADGSHIAFVSGATDLLSGEVSPAGQVYLYKISDGSLRMVSRAPNGDPADRTAGQVSISRTGQFVLFQSFAQNLVTCQPSCTLDELGYLYVRDTVNETITPVPTTTGTQAGRPAISGDGRYVGYSWSFATFVVDRETGESTRISVSGSRSQSRFSDDGRYFSFWAQSARNYTLWRYDRVEGTTIQATVDQNGNPLTDGAAVPDTFGPPGISNDGNVLAFWSRQDGVVNGDSGGIEDVYITTIRADAEAPQVNSITLDPASPVAGQSFSASATGNDVSTGGAAIIAGEFSIDNGPWLAAAATDGAFDSPTEAFERNFSPLTEDEYEICVRTRDGFGNESDGSECAKLIVQAADSSPPTWPGGTLDASQVGRLGVALTWSAAIDGGSGVKEYVVYRENQEIARLAGRSFGDTVPKPGNYAYRVQAVDAAGNASTSGPGATITITAPPIDILVNETITVNDNSRVLASLEILVEEIIQVLDTPLSLPAIELLVSERITVIDATTASNQPPINLDQILLLLPDGPLFPGSRFTADSGGWLPLSTVEAFLQSTPRLVGTEVADANGDVRFEITIPEDFPPGPHTLVLVGTGRNGNARQLQAPITISALPRALEDEANAIPTLGHAMLVLLALLLAFTARRRLRID